MIPLGDTIPCHGKPRVTRSLVLLNLFIFIWQFSLSEPQLKQWLGILGVIPARDNLWGGNLAPYYWTYFTYAFLHGSWMHVIGNMWTLWIFGDNVEDRLGSKRFLYFYCLCVICSALAQAKLSPTTTIPLVGASGAIAGVMGAYFILFPGARIILLIPIFIFPWVIQISAFFYLLLWLCMQFISGSFSLLVEQPIGGIAWWAHIAGFLVGAATFWIFLVWPGRKPTRPK